MISSIRPGDFHILKVSNILYAVHKASNQIYEIDEITYDYLKQELSDFVYDRNIEDYINEIVNSSNNGKKSLQLIINISAKNIETQSIVLKETLGKYNNYDRIHLVFDVYDDVLEMIETLTEWFYNNPKVYYIFRVREGKEYLFPFLKNWIKNNQKQSRAAIELYKVIYNESNENVSSVRTGIKISPFLMAEGIEKEKLVSMLGQSSFFTSLDSVYKNGFKLRDTDVVSITDADLINTFTNEDSACNKCWAQKSCYALNLYSIFSSHPLVCSLSKSNCDVIKDFTEQVIMQNIHQNRSDKTEIMEYHINDFKIIHLNP